MRDPERPESEESLDAYDPMIPGDDVAGGDPGLAERLEQSLQSLRRERGGRAHSSGGSPPYEFDLRPLVDTRMLG